MQLTVQPLSQINADVYCIRLEQQEWKRKKQLSERKTQRADIFQTEKSGTEHEGRHMRQTQEQLEMRRPRCSHQCFLHSFLKPTNLRSHRRGQWKEMRHVDKVERTGDITQKHIARAHKCTKTPRKCSRAEYLEEKAADSKTNALVPCGVND